MTTATQTTAPAKKLVKFKKTKVHTRYKTAEGLIVPGVTTVIGQSLGWNKHVLMAWQKRELLAGNDPDKIRDKAADIGTLSHFMVECHAKGQEPDTSEFSAADIDKAENGFLGFLEWEQQYAPEYIGSEIKMVSEKYNFGGTADFIARLGKKLVLLDLKTSKGVYIDHKIQVAAYKYAYEEQTGQMIDQVHILKLDKNTGAFEHVPILNQEIENCFLIFLHCLALYNLKKITDNPAKANGKIIPALYQSIRNQAATIHHYYRLAS